MVWSRKSCLGPARIVSFVYLVLFKNAGRKMSPRFHLFLSDVNQGNKTLTGHFTRMRKAFQESFGIHVPDQIHIHRCPPDILNMAS